MTDLNKIMTLEEANALPEYHESEEPQVPAPSTEEETPVEEETQDESEEATEEATEDESDSSEEPAEEPVVPKDKPTRARGAEKRIHSLVADQKELKRVIREMSTFDAPMPDRNDYEDEIDYKVDLKLYQREQARKDQSFTEEVQRLISEKPEIKELIKQEMDLVNSGVVTSNPTMVEAIKDSQIGVEIWHHLLKNPKEAARIARLSPLATAKEMGKLEAKLDLEYEEVAPAVRANKAPAAKPTEVKKPLPAPIKTVKATSKQSGGSWSDRFSTY